MAAVAAGAADVDVYDVDAVDTVVTEADLDWPATESAERCWLAPDDGFL